MLQLRFSSNLGKTSREFCILHFYIRPQQSNRADYQRFCSENTLAVAARCKSKLSSVIRAVFSRTVGSDAKFFLAVQAASRIVQCYTHILPLLLRFLRTSKSLLSLLEGAPSLAPHEASAGHLCVLNILKTALRLYEVAPESMLHMWEWMPVMRVLASEVDHERALAADVC